MKITMSILISIITFSTTLVGWPVSKFKHKEDKKSIQENTTTTSDRTYTLDSVISIDGTKIGYRQYGKGPGLIIVQGAMGTACNYHQLAIALAKDFTVYVPDRRGEE